MKKNNFLSILIFSIMALSCSNNTDVIKNAEVGVDEKVKELLSKMTLEEKIGQMTQVDQNALVDYNDITKYAIGSVLWGGNSEIADISAGGWTKMADTLIGFSLKTRLGIPILLGIDAVHGHNNVNNAVIFPHNIGLGCTRNPELVEEVAKVAAQEISATKIHWTFAPCVAVVRDERWGRTYESFSENPELVAQLGAAAVKGFENGNLASPEAVLSCTKHYMGDGGTTNGKDQGNAEYDEQSLRKIHLPGYISAMKEKTATIMISYSSWNGEKMHGHKYLITDLLKGELKYEGFIVSDWAAIDQLEGDYKSDIEKSINAGLDMIMIPNGPALQGKVGVNGQPINTYFDFIKNLKELVAEGKVPLTRIDDAVSRILKAKFNFDLFNKVKIENNLSAKVGSKENREVGRKAVQQSLVLLKNENNILPISKEVKNILVSGRGADNVGMQCGGWTISWQGNNGEVVKGGTSILNAVKNSVSKNTNVITSLDGSNAENADVIIVVVGENPYAEGFGDDQDLTLSEEDIKTISKVKESNKPFVVILLSGRPMIINNELEKANAFVAAWLPGSEGQGIADVLFGDVDFSGKLSFTWPKNIEQIPINVGDENYDPLFPYGYGLTYKK
ncbi:MAG: glycoside hydrolase family 3 C-terminal domain-containing protein [Ignavibacteriae bacterium]|nr:glycoside hydrolase family 3 C-terminal domain-containing protein [Ignavibacteriota bacterium]